MKKYIWLFIVVASNLQLFGQQQAPSFELKEQLQGRQEFQASQYVKMIDKFGYKPNTQSDIFHAKIDPFMTFPPEEGEFGGPAPGDRGVVGSIDGVFDVNELGAGIYTIPINLPQGIGNNVPQLSLNYNSMSGNGIMGMGWNIGGTSAINRTGKTIYHDGYVEGLHYNTNDNLSFNGMRMMPLENNIYTTEVEGFTRIEIKESNSTGPIWFEARTKDGRILRFGQTKNSRQQLGKTETIIAWYLSSIEDFSKNLISFSYESRNGNLLLKEISYGGNNTSKPKQEHIYKVNINYTTNRIDTFTSYVYGTALTTDCLLDNLAITYIPQNKVMFTYNLEYDKSVVLYSRLQRVKVTDEGSHLSYNSNNFHWGNFGNPTFSEISFNDNTPGMSVEEFFADINGDGLTDVIKIEYNNHQDGDYVSKKAVSWYYQLMESNNNFGPKQYFTSALPSKFFSNLLFGDFNGDGLVDFLDMRYNNVKKEETIIDRVFFSRGIGGGFDCYNIDPIKGTPKSYPEFKIGDFDGNGIQELLVVYKKKNTNDKNVFVFKFNESSPHSETVLSDRMDCGNKGYENSTILVADFTGDGRSDILRTAQYLGSPNTSNCFIYKVNLSTSKLEWVYDSHYPTTWHHIFPGDFNGDGITDILTYNYTAESPQWQIGFFNGKDGFVSCDNVPDIEHFNINNSIDYYWHSLILSDFNGDGKTDIIKLKKIKDTHIAEYTIYYSNGKDFPLTSSGDIRVIGGLKESHASGQIINEFIFPNMDFNGDGHLDLYVYGGINWGDKFYLHGINNESNRIKSFTNGLGNKTSLEYMPLTNSQVYLRNYRPQFPITNIQPPLFVVRTRKDDVCDAHTTTQTFFYEDLLIHRQGKGLLGFGKKVVMDTHAGISVETTNEIYSVQNKFFVPYAKAVKVLKADGYSVNETHNIFKHISYPTSPLRFFPFIESSTSYEIDIDNSELVKTKHSSSTYDLYGNMLTKMVLVHPRSLSPSAPESIYEHQSTTNFIYKDPDLPNWLIGLPEIITIKSRYLTEEKNEATVKFTYYPSTALIKERKAFPANLLTSELTTCETYTYDDFGNVNSATISAPNSLPQLDNRSSKSVYESVYHHRFPTYTTNAMEDTATSTYDPVYGTMKTSSSPNGLTTHYDSNPLGTFNKTTSPDGTIITKVTRWAKGHEHAPSKALYYTWQQCSGSPEIMVFYHKTGIEMRSVTLGFDGSTIYIDKIYNSKGLLFKESMPYKKGEDPLYTEYLYDEYNRINTVTSPDNTTTTTGYAANEINDTITNDNITRTSKKRYNAAGWLIESTDNFGGIVKNEYYCNGNLSKTYIVGQPATTVTLEYDDMGNRALLNDPNYGSMATVYNAYGELLQQTNPHTETTYYAYDKLGRVTTETGGSEGDITWTYSTLPSRIGTLENIIKNNHRTNFVYDDSLRLTSDTEIIDGTSYITRYTYDELGRRYTTTHPTGITVRDGYNDYGYPTTVSLEKNGKQLWKTEHVNPMGLVTKFKIGNGLVTNQNYYSLTMRLHTVKTAKAGILPVQDLEYGWFGLGNLEYRKKWLNRANNASLKESFTYDGLDRLSIINLNGTYTGNHVYDIDKLGNITNKLSDGNTIFSNAIYGSEIHGPHAITEVTTANPILIGPMQDISYNGYDKVDTITEGIHALQIQYGHHNQRISQQYTNGANSTDKVWAGACEFITKNGQLFKHTYLSGPMGVFALHIINPNGKEEINYIHKDHLGSWNTITDEDGKLLQELSFDAWGNRRDSATWRVYIDTPSSPLFDRGFTGHEHLYAFNLINMNGRVYDPILGRMLSPDNHMQAPGYSQNFNRYSYCLNNPLAYTDPSGDIFMMPFFIMAMAVDYTSNLINGVDNPLGTAYSNVTSTITGINNSCQIPVVKTDNFHLSVGLDPFSFGASINATYQPSENFSMSINAGIGPFGGNVNFGAAQKYGDFTVSSGVGYNSGYSNIFAKNPVKISGIQGHYGASYFDRTNNQHFSLGGNTLGGKYSQNTWLVGYRKGDFSFSFANDAGKKRGSDWFRTAAAEIGVGEVSFGFNLFTTEPPMSEYKSDPQKGGNLVYKSPIWKENKLNTYSTGSRVYAGMYLGYRNGNRISRVGVDAPWVQDLFQNGWHHGVVKTPYFNTELGSPSAVFSQGGYLNPFSLYPF